MEGALETWLDNAAIPSIDAEATMTIDAESCTSVPSVAHAAASIDSWMYNFIHSVYTAEELFGVINK